MTTIIVREAENRKFVFRYFCIFKKYLLSSYYILNTGLDVQDTALNTERQNIMDLILVE